QFLFHLGIRQISNILISTILCAISAYCVTLLPLPHIVALLGATMAGAITYLASITLSGEITGEIMALKSILNKYKR
ncbi:MAG: hypothetical protein N2Z65_08045, partial [Clostridiales bacterium]|nr:hypothetical protein [Clostridiales bacterium]